MKWIFTAVLLLVCVVRAGFFYVHQPRLIGGEHVHIRTTVHAVYMDALFHTYLYVSQLRIILPDRYEAKIGDNLDIFGTVVKTLTARGDVRYDLDIGTFTVIRSSASFEYGVSAMRNLITRRILMWMPGNEGALLVGILVGGNTGMTAYLRNMFTRVGLTHIIAASGYNVSVIVGLAQLVCVRLIGRRYSISIVIVCIILYALIAGMGAPIVRATIMAISSLIGMGIGRRSLGMWSLFLSLVGMVVYDPRYIFDVSFQLSASATAGLIFAERFAQNKSFLLANLITGGLVTLVSLPVVLYHFGRLAWLSPFLTIGVTLFVPYIMFIGLFSVAVGFLMPILGQIGVWLVWPLLKIITVTVLTVGGWSWASL